MARRNYSRVADIQRGQRLRAIREARGERATDFLEVLAREGGIRLLPSSLSRIENGSSPITCDDVMLWSQLDPLHRGPEWIAWGIDRVTPLRRGPVSDERERERPVPARQEQAAPPVRRKRAK